MTSGQSSVNEQIDDIETSRLRHTCTPTAVGHLATRHGGQRCARRYAKEVSFFRRGLFGRAASVYCVSSSEAQRKRDERKKDEKSVDTERAVGRSSLRNGILGHAAPAPAVTDGRRARPGPLDSVRLFVVWAILSVCLSVSLSSQGALCPLPQLALPGTTCARILVLLRGMIFFTQISGAATPMSPFYDIMGATTSMPTPG